MNEIKTNYIAVDGSCLDNINGKDIEYRGVLVNTGEELFRFKHPVGTNNIAEFIAIVHAMGYIYKNNIKDSGVYSDSNTAIAWVKKKECNTTFECDEDLKKLICRAENFLKKENPKINIEKWNTREWGEIPADFGRK